MIDLVVLWDIFIHETLEQLRSPLGDLQRILEVMDKSNFFLVNKG